MAMSVICALLLARAYARTHTKLLMWCALSFGLLAINNSLFVADLMLNLDLVGPRQAAAVSAAGVLIYGFISEIG